MARIAFAWELGGGLGHIGKIAPIARRFTALGHEVTAVLRDAAKARTTLERLGVGVLDAPALRGLRPIVGHVDSYADMLLHQGWGDPAALAAMLADWRDVLVRVRPDVVAAEFAPTAMLAARSLGIAVAMMGNGYVVPPLRRPMPFLRPWDRADPARLAAVDGQAARAAAAALARLGLGEAPPLAVADVLTAERSFICSFPELDHYLDRGEADYYGPLYVDDEGIAPPWPAGDGPRVFAYMHAQHPALKALLAALPAVGARAAVFAGGFSAEEARAASRPGLAVSAEPLQVAAAVAEADLVVCQGIGTVSAALVGGRKLVMFPAYLEQEMTLHRVNLGGFGVGLRRDADAARVEAALRYVLDNARIGDAVAAFAARYHGFHPSLPAGAIAEALAALAAGAGSMSQRL